MAAIIVEGHAIDTKDIWQLELITSTRIAGIKIKIINNPDIFIYKNIPYETTLGRFSEYWQPFEKLYDKVKEKWEADKTDVPIFKL